MKPREVDPWFRHQCCQAAQEIHGTEYHMSGPIIARCLQRDDDVAVVGKGKALLGLISQAIKPHRLSSVAIIVQPTTLLKFHRALVRRKYQRLFTAKNRKKPGLNGPSKELIEAIFEIKQRNPRFGSPRIADIITLTFGTPINKDVVRRVLAKYYKTLSQPSREVCRGLPSLVTAGIAYGQLTFFAANRSHSTLTGF